MTSSHFALLNMAVASAPPTLFTASPGQRRGEAGKGEWRCPSRGGNHQHQHFQPQTLDPRFRIRLRNSMTDKRGEECSCEELLLGGGLNTGEPRAGFGEMQSAMSAGDGGRVGHRCVRLVL